MKNKGDFNKKIFVSVELNREISVSPANNEFEIVSHFLFRTNV